MPRPDLVADCSACVALCCVATTFDASEDFAFDKPAGVPCRNLTATHRCAIHGQLAQAGFRGCASYDCFGAGQRVTRALALAGDGRDTPASHQMFLALRSIHEMLWYLTEGARLCPPSAEDLSRELAAEIRALDALAAGPLRALVQTDLGSHEQAARALLRRLGPVLSQVGSNLGPSR